MTIQRSSDEIEEQISKATEIINTDGTKVPGMSYEQGVDEALRWVLGESSDEPIEAT